MELHEHMDLRLASFSSKLKPRGGFTLYDATVSLQWLHMKKKHTHTHTQLSTHSIGAAVAIFSSCSFRSAFHFLFVASILASSVYCSLCTYYMRCHWARMFNNICAQFKEEIKKGNSTQFSKQKYAWNTSTKQTAKVKMQQRFVTFLIQRIRCVRFDCAMFNVYIRIDI